MTENGEDFSFLSNPRLPGVSVLGIRTMVVRFQFLSIRDPMSKLVDYQSPRFDMCEIPLSCYKSYSGIVK